MVVLKEKLMTMGPLTSTNVNILARDLVDIRQKKFPKCLFVLIKS